MRTLRVYTRRNAKVYRIAWLRQGHETRLTLRFVEVQWVNLLGPLTRGESKEFTSRLPALNRGVKGIRAHSVEGRREGRDRQQLRVLLASAGKPVLAESASTENITSCGARVRTGCRLQPETRLFVQSLQGEFWARARVVYCQTLSVRTFALGLEFLVSAVSGARRGERFRLFNNGGESIGDSEFDGGGGRDF